MNYIEEYYKQIKSNQIVVGEWIEKIYERIVNGIAGGDFLFDESKADDAVEWIETHCFHSEGALAPNSFKLELWQKALVSAIFGIVDANGFRQFREVVLVVARKNGKSLLASAIAKYIWYCDGYGTRVYCIAPKLEQADIIYQDIWQHTILDPEWQQLKEEIDNSRDMHNKKQKSADELAKRRQSDFYIPSTNSSVKKVAFASKRSDGYNPSLTICDEIASWEGDKGLKQYEVMKSGMGARQQALIISCSTSGYVNDSIYDELIKRGTRYLLGESKETRLLPLLYMIDDIEKWNDVEELKKSNPNLDVSVTTDYLKEEIAIAEGSLSKKAEFMTKYCNIKQNSSLAWLSAEDIKKACGNALRLEDFKSSYCVAGIDLSQTTDLTCASIVIQKDEELYVFAKFYLPAEKIDEATERDGLPYQQYIQKGWLELSGDNFVDYHSCYNWLTSLVTEHEILPLQIGYDRYSAQYLIQDLKSYGFQTDDVYQGENLYPVLKEFEGLLKDGRIHIGNNDLLKVHMLNSAIKMSTERGRGKLVKLNPSDHIDGMAAVADAFCVRQKHWETIGQQLRNE